MAPTHSRSGIAEGWPYACNRCGTTLYHDAQWCGDCQAPALPPADRRVRSRWRTLAVAVVRIAVACLVLLV